MLPWIIQMSVISLILIILVHYLYNFFKNNLTIPKVKDLVNKPQQQYETIFNSVNQNNTLSNNQNFSKNNSLDTNNNVTNNVNYNVNYSSNTIMNNNQDDNIDNNKMKDELKNYLKELSNSKNNNINTQTNNKGFTKQLNVNDNNGILTGENAMMSSFSTNNYATF